MQKAKFDELFRQLTKHQEIVLCKLLSGETDSAIAKSLVIAETTVRKHIQIIGEKFGLENQPGERLEKRSELLELFRQHKPDLVCPSLIAKGEKNGLATNGEGIKVPKKKRESGISGGIQGQLGRELLREHPYCNLPALTHPEFIGRKAELEQLLKFISLKYRAPIITVDGIGGVGKTALVLEAAYLCWEVKNGDRTINAPIFDAIIFISAKENYLLPTGIISRPQRHSTLRDIFRAIAATLDDQTITQAAPEDQLNCVYKSLGRQRTLLIVDNMETIEDKNEVIAFLSDLPPSTKAVITTREQVVLYANMRLDCLPETDSLQLIQQQAEEKGVVLTEQQPKQLYNRFGGVPVALIYAIGQLASGYPSQVLFDAASKLPEDIAQFCFQKSVQPLREQPAHNLLMSLAIFHNAPVGDALAEVAGLKTDPINMNKGLARLQQLSLVRQEEGRYSILPLTREYTLSELTAYPEFEKKARERWIKWYLDLAQRYGQDEWQEWHLKYDHLQEEGNNLLAVLYWCADRERYENVRDLWQCLNEYANIYGYWEERLFWTEWLIQQSERRGEWATVVYAMSQKSWTLTQMGGEKNLEVADRMCQKAWNLRDRSDFSTQAYLANNIARLRILQQQYSEARRWLKIEEELVDSANLEERYRIRRWLAVPNNEAEIYYLEGNYPQAKALYQQVMVKAQEIGWQRAINSAQNWLANIAIVQGEFVEAERLLNTGLPVAERNRNKQQIACYQASWARLFQAQGNFEQAREWMEKAIDCYQRLEMTRDAEAMRSLLDMGDRET